MFDKSNFKTRSFDILPFVRDFFKQPTGERNLTNVDENDFISKIEQNDSIDCRVADNDECCLIIFNHVNKTDRDQLENALVLADSYSIRRYLSDIKPFFRLSKALQNQILQEAWYECYPERRTIVRQDQIPACFYIVLSGSAIVTYKRLTDDHIQTLDIFDRGCTFGEKGLMTNSQQKFTVTSRTQVELLVLWKDDFKAIYMTNDRYCTKDDLKFLKNNVPILRGFPIDRLNEFPHAIQHCNYGQSEVIARDTRRMKHILVVKKGSIMIWKRLDTDGHTPPLSKHDFDQTDDDKMLDDNETEATQDNDTLFSEVQLSGDVDEPSSIGTTLDTDFRLSRLRRATTLGRRTSSNLSRSNSVIHIEKRFPGIADKRDRLPLIDYDELTINNNNNNNNPVSKLLRRGRSMANPKSKLILPEKMIYVHIKTLNEGQYFGLTDMLFSGQPALTLISNECECLLLRKSSFVRIASDQYKQNIRRTEIPFPPDSVFYKSYHTNEVWKRYSKAVYQNACNRMKLQHPQIVKRSSNFNQKKKQLPILIGAN